MPERRKNQSMARNFDDGVLERISDVLGTRLFEFTLNSDTDTLAIGEITDTQRAHVLELDAFLKGQLASQLDPESLKEALRGLLTDVSATPQPAALTAHLRCGGYIRSIETHDDLEAAIVEIARDVYPSFLLPPEYPVMPMLSTESFRVVSGLFRHPGNERFQTAALADGLLSEIFDKDNPTVGRSVMVYRSTFQGGSVQLSTLAGQALQSTWRDRPGEEPLTINEFISQSLNQWRFIKAALGGKEQEIRARVAFAGVLLPMSEEFDFGDVKLREVSMFERTFAPDSIKGQLSGTDTDGNQVTISYDGDVVADVKQPYLVKVDKTPLGASPGDFPAELTAQNPVEDASRRLRLSLLLAVRRQHRVQIVPSWRCFDDPFSHGRSMSWGDPKQAVNLMPTQLTESELEEWKRWYGLLGNEKADKLSLAVSRVVRATGERRDLVDVLIDSVIAWEALFGSKEGEPTLRVTVSLALLLEDDYARRRKLRSHLRDIYVLRSDVVHGTALPSDKNLAMCNEALDIAIQALKAILERRSDLLEEPDSTARSLRLMLGGATGVAD